MRFIAPILMLLVLLSPGTCFAEAVLEDWNDIARNRSVPVRMMMPTGAAAPYPVIIFSHGLGGSRENYTYLAEHWAKQGYFVVLVQHPGSDDKVWRGAVAGGREAIFKNMTAAANAQNLIARAQDVRFVLDQLERKNKSDPQLKGRLDLSKIAVAGHSFGAGTALAAAGVKYTAERRALLKDDRIKCAIYMSPPVNARQANNPQLFGDISVPGMVMTGTEDTSIIGSTRKEDRRIPFDAVPAKDQYLVNFNGGDHMIFSGRLRRVDKDDLFQPMILKLSTAFFDAYLKGDKQQLAWLKSGARQYLGNHAQYELK
jgi:predicted dienelactone hydrolase